MPRRQGVPAVYYLTMWEHPRPIHNLEQGKDFFWSSRPAQEHQLEIVGRYLRDRFIIDLVAPGNDDVEPLGRMDQVRLRRVIREMLQDKLQCRVDLEKEAVDWPGTIIQGTEVQRTVTPRILLVAGSCPRCGGAIARDEDQYGRRWHCLSCEREYRLGGLRDAQT